MTTVVPPEATLLDLAHKRLEALLEPDSETTSTLDAVMQRLFDPEERDLLTVSAVQLGALTFHSLEPFTEEEYGWLTFDVL